MFDVFVVPKCATVHSGKPQPIYAYPVSYTRKRSVSMKSFERIPLTSTCAGHARDPKTVRKSALDGKAPPAPGTNCVLDFLNSANITFSIVDHSPAFSSQAVRLHPKIA